MGVNEGPADRRLSSPLMSRRCKSSSALSSPPAAPTRTHLEAPEARVAAGAETDDLAELVFADDLG